MRCCRTFFVGNAYASPICRSLRLTCHVPRLRMSHVTRLRMSHVARLIECFRWDVRHDSSLDVWHDTSSDVWHDTSNTKKCILIICIACVTQGALWTLNTNAVISQWAVGYRNRWIPGIPHIHPESRSMEIQRWATICGTKLFCFEDIK